MRNTWMMRFVSVFSLKALLLFSFLSVVTNVEAAMVNVLPGTRVQLATTGVLKPENLNIGDAVNLTVTQDVVVDGKVIIKAGSLAMGEVVSSKKKNLLGIPGAIGISLKSVTTVDGKSIPISASKHVQGEDKMVMSIGLSLICCILFALVKGGEATIPAGTLLDGMTTMAVEVTA